MRDPRLIVVTHPEVVIEPEHPIPDWGLSAEGELRAQAFACSAEMAQVSRIWCSAERKARETADILALPRDIPISEMAALGENDRSATGFLPPAEFEAAADAFFAAPDVSFRGWERAIDAQDRITAALHQILPDHGTGDLAIVTHGAVGTLLWCRLMNCPIDRKHDQPGQGHFWIADLRSLEPTGGWQPIA